MTGLRNHPRWRAPPRTDSTSTPDLDREDLPNIEDLLANSYGIDFSATLNDLSESCPCALKFVVTGAAVEISLSSFGFA